MVCSGHWDEQRKVILLNDGHSFARGLTKTLDACFCPDFSIRVVLSQLKRKKAKRSGKFIGNKVDRELDRWVKKKRLKNPHPYLLLIQNVLKQNEWTPIASQLDLACSALRLGTRIDLICENNEKELIIIELKCGFEDYYDVANQGNMLYPFTDVEISCRNKHYLQLWMTSWLFFHCQHSLSGRKVANAYVLRIFNESQVELNPLPYWLVADGERLRECIKVLKRCKNDTKRNRMRILKNGSQRSVRRYKKMKR
jgi:hypothetical protein